MTESLTIDQGITTELFWESQERFRRVFDDAAIGIVIVDLKGRFLDINPAFSAMLGRSASALLDASMFEITHPDDRLTSQVALRRLLAGELRSMTLEKRYLKRTGEIVPARLVISLTRDAHGEPLYFIGQIQDITAEQRAEERSRSRLALLTALTESILDGVLVVADDGRILASNAHFSQLWNIPEKSLTNAQTIDVLRPFALEQVTDPATFVAEVEHLYDSPQAVDQKQIRLKDGRILDRYTSPIADPDGAVYGRVWLYRDITAQVQMEQVLHLYQTQLNEAQRLAGLGSWEWRIATNEVSWSDETYRIFGRLPGSVQPTLELFIHSVHPAEREQVWQAITATLEQREPYELDITICRPDGTERVVQTQGTPTVGPSGTPTGMLGTILDITERKALEARLAHQAQHDPLTGLPNRRLFGEHLERALSRITQADGQLALLFLDLDNFKVLNDHFGHDVGDDVLIAVGERLQRFLHPGVFAARLGGDEFVILLEEIMDEATAPETAKQILAALRQPIAVTGAQTCTLTGSIGIVVTDDEQVTAQDLLQQSDKAMYRAKEHGGACWVVDDLGSAAASRDEVSPPRTRRTDRLTPTCSPIVTSREFP